MSLIPIGKSTCSWTQEHLWSYLAGEELPAKTRIKLEKHINQCGACRIELGKKQDALSQLAQVGAPVMRVMADELVSKSNQQPDKIKQPKHSRIMALSLLLLLLTGLGVVMRFSDDPARLILGSKMNVPDSATPSGTQTIDKNGNKPSAAEIVKFPFSEGAVSAPKPTTTPTIVITEKKPPEDNAKTTEKPSESEPTNKEATQADNTTESVNQPDKEPTKTDTSQKSATTNPTNNNNEPNDNKSTVKTTKQTTTNKPAPKRQRKLQPSIKKSVPRTKKQSIKTQKPPVVTIYSPSGKVVGEKPLNEIK